MKHISAILIYLMAMLFTSAKAQTTHIITMPSSGNNTIDVNCAVGDIITLQSSVTPFAIQVFRNPTPNFTVPVTGTSTSYTVTAIDTSYSSIITLSPSISTCKGKIILSAATNITEATNNKNQLLLFPNPVHNLLKIEGVSPGLHLELIDITGKIIKDYTTSSFISEIDIAELQEGIYFIRSEKVNCKFVKTKFY